MLRLELWIRFNRDHISQDYLFRDPWRGFIRTIANIAVAINKAIPDKRLLEINSRVMRSPLIFRTGRLSRQSVS